MERDDIELGDEAIAAEIRRPAGARIAVRVTAGELDQLQDIAEAGHLLVTEVVRAAVSEYLARRRPQQSAVGS